MLFPVASAPHLPLGEFLAGKRKMLNTTRQAAQRVFQEKIYFFPFILGALFFGSLYTFVPVFVTPGNTFSFFIEITPWWDFALLVALALMMGLLVAMQVYVFRNRQRIRKREVGTGVIASFSSFVSGIFSSATCASCVSALFSFLLPSSGIFFLLNYRWEIAGIGFLLVLLSLTLVSRRIVKGCAQCEVKTDGELKK